jgi:glucose/arabinose dehydrogenase
MRMIMLAATGAALILTGAANAQAPSAQPTPETPPAAAPQSPAAAPAPAPAIKTVSVVALDELPEDTRNQINQLLASRTADQLERLRKAIENAPAAKSALEAKGFSSRDVVIAQIDDEGALTIVTTKAG